MDRCKTRTAQEPTAVTAARSIALLKRYGIEYGITYEWSSDVDMALSAYSMRSWAVRWRGGLRAVQSQHAPLGRGRRTHWTMRTDSPEHLAFKALVATLEN